MFSAPYKRVQGLLNKFLPWHFAATGNVQSDISIGKLKLNFILNKFFQFTANNTNYGGTSKRSECDYAENVKLSNGNVRLHLATPGQQFM